MRAYPRPQFVRKKWQSLDGDWAFDFDDKRLGMKEKWYKKNILEQTITVPFAYQAKASGVNNQEVHDCVWYSKSIALDQFDNDLLVLHFGGSDYLTHVWVEGEYCGNHEGGHSPFSFDITNYVQGKKDIRIDVCVYDYSFSEYIPRGKQNFKGKSEGIFYTGTTGIWQSVWLEYLPQQYLKDVKYETNTLTNELKIVANICCEGQGQLETKIYREGELIISDLTDVVYSEITRTFELPDFNDHHYGYWWTPDTPNLYDVTFRLIPVAGQVDEVKSYFGMRSVSIEDKQVCLNHLPFYTKSVLYQGYYPDSLMTAKTDAELKADVELIKQMGFNSIRLHQKFEQPRLLYWCDQLGLMVWGEAPNAYSYSNEGSLKLLKEFTDIVKRDYNHPSLCVWVPLNESWGIPKIKNDDRQKYFATAMYTLTKALDPTRLVISNDGWEHTISDICTIHDYEADLNIIKQRYHSLAEMLKGPQNRMIYVDGYDYNGEPILLSEFGGIAYDSSGYGEKSWGYSGANNQAEFEDKVINIIKEVQQSPLLQGYCYTQFNDLEQEVNGLVTMNREPKISIEKLAQVNKLK